ncbi:acyl-CoA N-acyltransferase [Thozetella sp. PMI_491]|nr:acyl-CoA N-acyltransferase [Thozetella sp. PMI_491]
MIPLTIRVATRDDLPALAKINAAAYARETIAMFAFKKWPDDENMTAFFASRIGDRLDQPESQVFAAVQPDSDKMYGFVCFTLKDGPDSDSDAKPAADPTGAAMQKLGQTLNLEFIGESRKQMQVLKDGIKGEKHYYLSAFAADPTYQGQGIGTKLLEHCLRISDQAGLKTWLNAFPGSHTLYLRHRFTDVKYHDMDLNEWDKGRLRGYGIYRSYLMMREPIKA